MRLIPISDNVFINPEEICSIRQVNEMGKLVIYIRVDGEDYKYEYEYKVPIGDFIAMLREENKEQPTQIFAG